MRLLLTLTSLFLIALPLQANASKAPNAVKFSAIVTAADRASEDRQLEVQLYLNDAVAEYQGIIHRRPETLFPVEVPQGASNSFRRATQGYQESRRAFDKKNFADAERFLRATLKELKGSTPALPDAKILAEVTAMYGAVMLERGDVEEARWQLLELNALNPEWELSTKRYSKEYLALRESVRRSPPAQLRGTVNVASVPSGGRVLVDGEFKGFAPQSIHGLTMGRHFIQVERSGHETFGAFVDVSPEPVDVLAELTPTQAQVAWNGLASKLVREIDQPTSNAAKSLGPRFDLDRVFIGRLREDVATGRHELSVALFDVRGGRRLGQRVMTFRGDEYGQLRQEVGRLIHQLLADVSGSREKVRRSGDPLNNVSGTSDWDSDRQRRDAKKEKTRQRYQGRDPLDARSGMEDW
ncbi:MAG TPA: PEGA domain-containing protein [Myxococcaceae bacterium]|nr:PEGA domain-containing protein [Myxococcaceae bacterium]